MVQFKSEEKVQSLLEKWTESTLDSVKVRPAKSPEKNVGMLPHVPLDLNLSAIQEDLDKIYPGSVCTRIEKNHAPTRTVKVVFKDKKFLEDALEKGIKSSNLQSIWLVQLPYSRHTAHQNLKRPDYKPTPKTKFLHFTKNFLSQHKITQPSQIQRTETHCLKF